MASGLGGGTNSKGDLWDGEQRDWHYRASPGWAFHAPWEAPVGAGEGYQGRGWAEAHLWISFNGKCPVGVMDFLDGDSIELFLDLSSTNKDKISKDIGVSVAELTNTVLLTSSMSNWTMLGYYVTFFDIAIWLVLDFWRQIIELHVCWFCDFLGYCNMTRLRFFWSRL